MNKSVTKLNKHNNQPNTANGKHTFSFNYHLNRTSQLIYNHRLAQSQTLYSYVVCILLVHCDRAFETNKLYMY